MDPIFTTGSLSMHVAKPIWGISHAKLRCLLALLSFRHNRGAPFTLRLLDDGKERMRMPEALQINFALWGMILCSAMKAAQWIESAF
jgi:hypothetical protein